MEKIIADIEALDNKILETWNRPRSNKQLLGFISTKLAHLEDIENL